MLKQTFDRDTLAKSLSKKDVWKWNLWINESEQNSKLIELEKNILAKNGTIDELQIGKHRGKNTYQTSTVEDALSIRILDLHLRKIYKVKQSDRHLIIKQLKTLLLDNGDYIILRLDIQSCYENINFKKIFHKISNDMLLSPQSLNLIGSVIDWCHINNVDGLPRGLSISPTLMELYLEKLDKDISISDGVIFSNRYVDDYIVLIEKGKEELVEEMIRQNLSAIGLEFNTGSNKYYCNESRSAEFVYLGYAFKVGYKKNKVNDVSLTISNEKINKIKSKVISSFIDFKITSDFRLLNQRLNYLMCIRSVKEHENGNLLGGISYSYKFVTDSFECLRVIDGFYSRLVNSKRFSFSPSQKSVLLKKSFYGSVKNSKKATFTMAKTKKITKVWKNA